MDICDKLDYNKGLLNYHQDSRILVLMKERRDTTLMIYRICRHIYECRVEQYAILLV